MNDKQTPPAEAFGSTVGLGAWLPIETAPQDDTTYFLATNGSGVWMAHWEPVAVGGYRFENPWRSVLRNHWHIKDHARKYGPPTHWMPLPEAPSV